MKSETPADWRQVGYPWTQTDLFVLKFNAFQCVHTSLSWSTALGGCEAFAVNTRKQKRA